LREKNAERKRLDLTNLTLIWEFVRT